jgi:hypothetical protein
MFASVRRSASALPWVDVNRWDEKSGLQRDALSSQVIDALEAQEIKEADYEEAYPYGGGSDT